MEISIISLHRRSPCPGGRKQSRLVGFSLHISSVLSSRRWDPPACHPGCLLEEAGAQPLTSLTRWVTFPTSSPVLPFVSPLCPNSGPTLTLPFTSEIGRGSAGSSYVTARPFGVWGRGYRPRRRTAFRSVLPRRETVVASSVQSWGPAQAQLNEGDAFPGERFDLCPLGSCHS